MAEGGQEFDSVGDSRHVDKTTAQYLTSDSTEMRLCKDHGKPFTYFCKGHVVELCISCKVAPVHRTCRREDIIEINQAVKENYSERHGINVKRGIQVLLEELNQCKCEALNIKDDLPTRKQSAINKVKQTRKSIDAYLDKLEDSAIADIDTFYYNEDDVLSEQIHICEAAITVLQKRVDSIKRVADAGNDIERFTEVNNANKEIKDYFPVLQDICQKIVRDDATFKENEEFVELMNTSQNLGTVTVIRNDIIRGPVDWIFIYTGELILKTEGNSDNSHIVRYYEVLTDGRQLLLDKKNRKLQMFDAAYRLLAELTFPVTPLGLAVMSDTECLISTSHQRQLFSITIGESLKLSDTKTTHQSIGPMIKFGDNVFAVIRTGSQFSISVINRQGRIQRSIIIDDGSLFEWPAFLALSADEKTVYVLDRAKGCIALALDGGKVVFHHEDSESLGYSGLSVGQNCIYIGVEYKQTKGIIIRLLDCSGAMLKDINCGNSYPLRTNNYTLASFNSRAGCINFHFIRI